MAKRWRVEITIAATRGPLEEETAVRLRAALDADVAVGPDRLTMSFTAEGDGPATAATRAVAHASRASTTAGLGEIASRITRVELTAG